MDNAEAELRVNAARKVAMLLQEAIEQNRNVYSGSLVPNFTSLLSVLCSEFELIAPTFPDIDARFDAMMTRYGLRSRAN